MAPDTVPSSRLRVCLAQLNTSVGDIAGNCDRIVEWTGWAAEAGADIVAFPEMAVVGYQVDDLALRPSFVAASQAALTGLAGRLAEAGYGDVVAIVGYLDGSDHVERSTGRPAGSPQDAMAVLHQGRVIARSAKHHLPNYGVFDEFRYFVPGDTLPVVRVRGVDVAIVICEDLWQDGGPVSAAREAGAGFLLAINASPYELAKDDARLALVRRRAAEAGCALAYVNQVGGQDELVFDGDSVVVDAVGAIVARGGQFTEELLTFDLDLPIAEGLPPTAPLADGITVDHVLVSAEPAAGRAPIDGAASAETCSGNRLSDNASIWGALVLGLRDYVRKNGFRSVVIALSGGIDSALSTAIACDALGPENVYCYSMPSKYSSEHSRGDAAEMARRTGVHFGTIPIEPMVEAFLTTVGAAATPLTGVAEENLQARVRGTVLMALSNEEGHLVLANGNKSELAVGYSTLYGDAVGGYAPLKDLFKVRIWELARWRDKAAAERGEVPPIPENSIEKPPSAELRPDQLDTDSLADYPVLDRLLDLYVEQDRGRDALIASGFDEALVDRTLRLVDLAEYKRRQYPPGTKITGKAFGRDRRLPITNAWRESSLRESSLRETSPHDPSPHEPSPHEPAPRQ
ncbi:NAD+ synthase [Catenulispora pinisilvae]|uniref:NAD+ synthase n=1 Tax=Catenulispora pinisilvae TaxID=2705253 RepID=UPI00189256F1|nr:NAD+ synthase [Catenulispora pinisilvae]